MPNSNTENYNTENIILLSKQELTKKLWSADPHIRQFLKKSKDLHCARNNFFEYLNELERHYFNIFSDNHFKNIHILEKNNAKECIRVLKNIIRTENEKITGFSALKRLSGLAKDKNKTLPKISEGFLCEFIYLFKGINGKSGILRPIHKDPDLKDANEIAVNRSSYLDSYSKTIQEHFKKYKDGCDAELLKSSKALKKEILDYFESTEKDWEDYSWQLNHVIKDRKTLSSLIKLNKDEASGLKCAEEKNIPFQITPYYLSLFNKNKRSYHDRVLRAQVIPSLKYCSAIKKNCESELDLDFMGEKFTSPIKSITRRYPQILILKPFDSCPQICVYCQRNWEIKSLEETKTNKKEIQKAIDWIKDNESITEVLVTGGDPLTLNNKYLGWLLDEISKIKRVERIRIGTRTLVTLPFRFDKELLKILEKHHCIGKREICIVTHFEHPVEITPDSIKAIKKIKKLGISIYNQQVFTYYNSKKFETSFLRKKLKLSGIDPYYTFNTKGKEETIDFRVPIARIEQERKEEARLLPGIVRTDEPVFNVPKLGKSHLRAWQDHEPIMVLSNGKRIYRFYPWESKLNLTDDYIYTDVPIYDYLKRLHKDNENTNDYHSIWYYF
ncbi:MAG: KamA family radical SAM protein [Candidatus Diapherotrites archaeon]|nr:KamA family radical SAM protein [Candidatus Diapherotrites archaeon]